MTCGIYKITNKINGKAYIGASENIEERWHAHKYRRSQRMYHIIKKYGKTNFTFEILEECLIEEFYNKERYYIKLYNTKIPKGYNLTDGGEHNFNSTGYYRVNKITTDSVSFGYLFGYKYIGSQGKVKQISSKSILDLEEKVKDKNLPWKIIDNEKANKTLNENLNDLNKLRNKYPRNKTGYYKVHKEKRNNDLAEYTWVYVYRVNGKKRQLRRLDLNELKEEVLNRGLLWEIIDNEKAEISDKENKIQMQTHSKRNPTGYYNVRIHKLKNRLLGYRFEYKYKGSFIGSSSLRVLEQKIKCKGLKWKILDETLALKTLEKNDLDLKNINYSPFKNNTGLYHVNKYPLKESKKGFTYAYSFTDENKKFKRITSVDINELENKIKSKNLPWLIIDEGKFKQLLKEDELAKQQYENKSEDKFSQSGVFGVTKVKNNQYKQGFHWVYRWHDDTGKIKRIKAITLQKLEHKVKNKGLPWEVLDEKKVKENIKTTTLDEYKN